MGSEDTSQALLEKAKRSKCNSQQNPPVTFADAEGGDAPGLRLRGLLSPPSLLPALPPPCPLGPACHVHCSPSRKHVSLIAPSEQSGGTSLRLPTRSAFGR